MNHNYNKQYDKFLQNKIKFANSINPNTFNFNDPMYRNIFYNDHENGLIGNRPNKPSDYTTIEQRTNNSINFMNSSNSYMKTHMKKHRK